MALLCRRMDINVWEVIDLAATKPYGFMPFYPGPGIGGHCIPIDPFYLTWKAREYDFNTRFVELAGEINTHMPYEVVLLVTDALGTQGKPLAGSKVLVLGAAYKRDVADCRESPALRIMEILQKRGAKVSYNDPFVPAVEEGTLRLQSVPMKDIFAWDCVVIATAHSSYDYPEIVEKAQLVVDTRNATKGLSAPHLHVL
jgi:UDP-N-acetyl-D-glucosamine dehydrogenase